jgi:lysophospholipase L1-like esterase
VTVLPPLKLSLTRFVAFGDSLTYGEDGQSLRLLPPPETFKLFGQTYPDVLQAKLRGRYTLQSPTVMNAGQPGEFASNPDTVTRFSNGVTRTQVDVVLLMEGSNDVGFISRDSFVEIAAIANIRDMLRTAKSRGVKPFLATIPPQLESGFRGVRGAKYVVEFNDRLKTLASSEGVPLVDVYEGLNAKTNTYISQDDGLHPTVAGYAKIADMFLSAIEGALETGTATSGTSIGGRSLTALSRIPTVENVDSVTR